MKSWLLLLLSTNWHKSRSEVVFNNVIHRIEEKSKILLISSVSMLMQIIDLFLSSLVWEQEDSTYLTFHLTSRAQEENGNMYKKIFSVKIENSTHDINFPVISCKCVTRTYTIILHCPFGIIKNSPSFIFWQPVEVGCTKVHGNKWIVEIIHGLNFVLLTSNIPIWRKDDVCKKKKWEKKCM